MNTPTPWMGFSDFHTNFETKPKLASSKIFNQIDDYDYKM